MTFNILASIIIYVCLQKKIKFGSELEGTREPPTPDGTSGEKKTRELSKTREPNMPDGTSGAGRTLRGWYKGYCSMTGKLR